MASRKNYAVLFFYRECLNAQEIYCEARGNMVINERRGKWAEGRGEMSVNGLILPSLEGDKIIL